jgi:DNA-binding transcriptional ArsR family regulator
MSDNIDDIKKELDEVRRLKEELKQEVEDAKRQKEEMLREKDNLKRARSGAREDHPPRAPREPKPLRPLRPVKIDLRGITDSLEDMMDDLGRSIEMSIKDIDGIRKDFRIPGVHIKTGGRKDKIERRRDIENIPPERITRIVSPLGSEERLRILDYLKTGGKSFNDIETFTGKTGSSLTHHLNPLLEAGYVVKGEVRGTYYVTVEGRLAYRLAQWLTHRVEQQREKTGNTSEGEIDVEFDDASSDNGSGEDEEEVDREVAAHHLERVSDRIERVQDKVEDAADIIEEAQDALDEEDEDDEDDDEDDEDDEDDNVDDFDWND